MTKTADSYTHWFIFDGVGAVDGEVHNKYADLLRSVGWHEQPDYVVLAFDAKAWKAGETALVDVTNGVSYDWWMKDGSSDTLEKVRAGERLCFLAEHLPRREVEIMQNEIYGAANAADRWRDERAAAE